MFDDINNSLDFYRKIFHHSGVGMSVYDSNGQCIEANDAIGNLIGAPKEEKLLQNYFHLDSWKKSGLLNVALSAIAENVSKHFETNVTTTFGRHITIDYHFIPILVADQPYLLLIATDITKRKTAEEAQKSLVSELRTALNEVKTLRGILPICSSCKKIRNDEGGWEHVEVYIRKNTEAGFTHGICPACITKLYPEFDSEKKG